MSSVHLAFISDTHSLHHELKLGSGDILVHCGDFTGRGSIDDAKNFAEFMAKQDFKHKVVIAGNHDWCFEDHRRVLAESLLSDHDIHYLNDSGVRLGGLNFWGSPVQPAFMNWAFNRERGLDIRRHWELIPEDVDVLITHGPAFGILDLCCDGQRVGCEDLLATVQRIKPRIHACGHIHEGYGQTEKDGTLFLNASNLDERYQLVNPPIMVRSGEREQSMSSTTDKPNSKQASRDPDFIGAEAAMKRAAERARRRTEQSGCRAVVADATRNT